MKRSTHQRLSRTARLTFVIGLVGAIAWNLTATFTGLGLAWLAPALPLPGLLAWLGLAAVPAVSARKVTPHPDRYRLLYSSPAGWRDERARQALLTLVQSGTGLDIIWAKDGEDVACWLTIAQHGGVLERLVRDVFPYGALETAEPPAVGAGVVVLHWQQTPPTPAELCGLPGLDGVHYRYLSAQAATVALWGPAAADLARQWARPADILVGQNGDLLAPRFSGDNPWPSLPSFPETEAYPGLAAVSTLERVAPALRTQNRPALGLGQDREAEPVGFPLPELAGLGRLQISGQATEAVVISLIGQAVQAQRPVLLLDGQGVVATRLARRLLREVATERVLLCDVERPAQSRFRLNPLWLPAAESARARALATGWPAWLREQGVTPAGLGLAAYRHTQVAVSLTALVAQQRGLALDVPGLCEALRAPDFLKLVDTQTWAGSGLLSNELGRWWQSEGQATASFDLHLHLAHLRDRLGALLELPEYSVLWRGPYLDPLTAVSGGQSLLWRLPDPRRRLAAYVSSQLLALHTLLSAWPAGQPAPLIFLHELQTEGWLKRLADFAGTRLVVSTAQAPAKPSFEPASSLLLSRLDNVPAWLTQALPGVRPTDLKRLPPDRLLLKQGDEICTLNMSGD